MGSVSRGQAFIVTAAVGVAATALYLWQRRTGSQELDGTLSIPKVRVIKFLEIINSEQRAMVAHFRQKVAPIQDKIPKQHLLELATTNFEEHLAKTQAEVLKGMGISEEDMEDASLRFAAAGDTQVQNGMKQLRNMYMAFAELPNGDVDIPNDLTAEKMVEVVKVYFVTLMAVARNVVEELLSQGKSFQDPASVGEINDVYQKKSQTEVDTALRRFNLDSNTIQGAIEKFAENKDVQNALAMGTMSLQQLLSSYGLG